MARKFASSVVHCTHTWKSVRLLSGENGSKFLPTLKPSGGQFQSYHLEKVGQLSRKKNGGYFWVPKCSSRNWRNVDTLISPKMTAADQECKKPWVQLSNSSFLEPFGPPLLTFSFVQTSKLTTYGHSWQFSSCLYIRLYNQWKELIRVEIQLATIGIFAPVYIIQKWIIWRWLG